MTDRSGNPYQYFHYTAWGESFAQAEASQGSFSSSYRFNAKELDQETGNYYYGARYYHPKWSVWLSVDPLAGNDPHMNPYHFVNDNPISIIDPDGRTGYAVGSDGGIEPIDPNTNPNEAAAGGSEYDVLYSNDLQRTALSTFDPGTFQKTTDEPIPTSSGPVTVQEIDFTENCEDQARGAFEFLRSESSTGANAGIEYSLTTGETNGDTRTLLTVSRNQVGVEYGYNRAILKLSYQGYTNVISTHFHPNNTGPSGYGLNGDPTIGGDKTAVTKLFTTLSNNGWPIPKMRVDNYDGSLYEYDPNQVKKLR